MLLYPMQFLPTLIIIYSPFTFCTNSVANIHYHGRQWRGRNVPFYIKLSMKENIGLNDLVEAVDEIRRLIIDAHSKPEKMHEAE